MGSGTFCQTRSIEEMKYKVKIVETLSKIVEVDASCMAEAHDKVEKMYNSSEVVLDDASFEGYELYVL